MPELLLAVLFGLSMDYQVFLVSRMAEEWSHTRDNARSVLTGQTHTARVITAAAMIMIAVFIAFVFMGQVSVAEFGIGLAAAVALDAFVLRTVLVPAVMHLAAGPTGGCPADWTAACRTWPSSRPRTNCPPACPSRPASNRPNNRATAVLPASPEAPPWRSDSRIDHIQPASKASTSRCAGRSRSSAPA